MADREFTSRLVAALKSGGIPYWIDREHPLSPQDEAAATAGPGPENPVFMRLCEAIEQASLLLFVFSATSISREFVRLELDPRVLLGPGLGKPAVIVKVTEFETIAPELAAVFAAIERPRVWDLSAVGFDRFFSDLRSYWHTLKPAPRHTEWRSMPNFNPREAAVPARSVEATAAEADRGRALLAKGQELMRAGDLDAADEAIADAYAALRSAGDAAGVIDALYATFEVSLLIGRRLLAEKRETFSVGGMTVRDSYLDGRREISYALEALDAAIAKADELGEQELAQSLRGRYESVEAMLRTEQSGHA